MFVTCFAMKVTERAVVVYQCRSSEIEDSTIRPRTRSRGNNDQDGTQSMFRLGHFSSAGGSPDHLRRKTAPNARGYNKEAGRKSASSRAPWWQVFVLFIETSFAVTVVARKICIFCTYMYMRFTADKLHLSTPTTQRLTRRNAMLEINR